MMYEKDGFLTDLLAVVAQNWIDGFRKTWGLDAGTSPSDINYRHWELARIFDQIAARFVDASRTLERNQDNLDELLTTLREEFGVNLETDPFFIHALDARLAGGLEDELKRMRDRTLKLVRYLVDVRSVRAQTYLMRVSACFLRGLKTETVVMIGAVIDAALQELLNDEEIRKSGIKCGRRVSLGNRIKFMEKRRFWDKTTVDIAFRLAKERNNALHTAPDLTRDVSEVMKDLVYLLKRMPDEPKIRIALDSA